MFYQNGLSPFQTVVRRLAVSLLDRRASVNSPNIPTSGSRQNISTPSAMLIRALLGSQWAPYDLGSRADGIASGSSEGSTRAALVAPVKHLTASFLRQTVSHEFSGSGRLNAAVSALYSTPASWIHGKFPLPAASGPACSGPPRTPYAAAAAVQGADHHVPRCCCHPAPMLPLVSGTPGTSAFMNLLRHGRCSAWRRQLLLALRRQPLPQPWPVPPARPTCGSLILNSFRMRSTHLKGRLPPPSRRSANAIFLSPPANGVGPKVAKPPTT